MGRPGSEEAVAMSSGSPEIERLRMSGKRQAAVIATLSEAVSNLHRGMGALRAENAALRAEATELRGRDASRSDDELVEISLVHDARAPSVARRIVLRALGARAAPGALENAQLVMSELVTDSVTHGGAQDGDELVVRVRVWRDRCRLEVEDSDCGELVHGAGIGQNLVQALSEHWGLVRAARGPTRVWAQLPL